MATPRTRNTRVFTISFPEELAKQVEETARAESRTVSELFRQSFRAYRLQHIQQELDAFQKSFPLTNYTEDDVEDLVHEVRREQLTSQVA